MGLYANVEAIENLAIVGVVQIARQYRERVKDDPGDYLKNFLPPRGNTIVVEVSVDLDTIPSLDGNNTVDEYKVQYCCRSKYGPEFENKPCPLEDLIENVFIIGSASKVTEEVKT